MLCDCELFSSSSGSSGFSLLPGVSGSLGSVPEPLPPTSPPPPGGQKGHIHVGPCIPNPPVPPFHQLPPGPTIMTAAEMVNLLPSLLVSTLERDQWCCNAIQVIHGTYIGVFMVVGDVIVAKLSIVVLLYAKVTPPITKVVSDSDKTSKVSDSED